MIRSEGQDPQHYTISRRTTTRRRRHARANSNNSNNSVAVQQQASPASTTSCSSDKADDIPIILDNNGPSLSSTVVNDSSSSLSDSGSTSSTSTSSSRTYGASTAAATGTGTNNGMGHHNSHHSRIHYNSTSSSGNDDTYQYCHSKKRRLLQAYAATSTAALGTGDTGFSSSASSGIGGSLTDSSNSPDHQDYTASCPTSAPFEYNHKVPYTNNANTKSKNSKNSSPSSIFRDKQTIDSLLMISNSRNTTATSSSSSSSSGALNWTMNILKQKDGLLSSSPILIPSDSTRKSDRGDRGSSAAGGIYTSVITKNLSQLTIPQFPTSTTTSSSSSASAVAADFGANYPFNLLVEAAMRVREMEMQHNNITFIPMKPMLGRSATSSTAATSAANISAQ